MKEAPLEVTLEELRARIKAIGLHIAEARLEMVRLLLSEALAPVRAMDARAMKTLEPAVTFNAGWPPAAGDDGYR